MSKISNTPDSSLTIATRHVASTRFEAARQLTAALRTDKFSRLHGHGFLVSAFVDKTLDEGKQGAADPQLQLQPSSLWPPYSGGEVPALLEQLQGYSRELDYQSLNAFMPDPNDINVARWFGERFGGVGEADRSASVSRLALQSTPDQGVVIDAGQHGGGSNAPIVWRRYRFQAAHQLPHVPAGHKCGRLHGHGFEVVLYVACGDESITYQTLDLAWEGVFGLLGWRCLNDIPGLDNPTSEMLSSWLWQRLRDNLPSLVAVSVYETASCGATFDGERYRIWKDFTIDSATRYRHAGGRVVGGVGGAEGIEDPRARVHGYTYTLRLNLSAPLDQVMGWTVDFGDVKEVFSPLFKALDHHPLHDNPELALVSDGDTGSMARWLFVKTRGLLPELVGLDLFETEGCGSSVGTDLPGVVLPLVRA